MKSKGIFLSAAAIIFLVSSFSAALAAPRYTENWWSGWKFLKATDPAGASTPSFNDAAWSTVTIPHDYTMDGPYSQSNATPDNATNTYTQYATWKKAGSQGYLPREIGWYRKTFTVASADSGKKVFIEFDGAFRNSYTYINGTLLGNNFSGYTSFVYDMTPYIKFGASNVLAVKLDAVLNEGWWYEGRGIYRPVRLVITDKLRVARWGTYVTTPAPTTGSATINIRTKVTNGYSNSANCALQSLILDMTNSVIGTVSSTVAIAANGTYEFKQSVNISSPKLWCPENPYLYKVVSKVSRDAALTDEYTTTFGIRTFNFDANKGFFCNGKHYKLNGVCNHDDYAGLGVAVPKQIHYQNIKQMADAGIILLRGAHNARSPEEMDACDAYGVFVWAETRYFKNTAFDSSALVDLIQRDRNHPSIIFWSLANENELQGTAEGLAVGTRLKRVVLQEDSTRPVTSAVDRSWVWDGSQGVSAYKDLWDVSGYNWIAWNLFDPHHSTYSNRKFFVSEYRYNTDAGSGLAADEFILQRDYIAGGTMWSGYAYKGEAAWPALAAGGSLWNIAHEPVSGFWKAKAEYGFQMNKWSVHVDPSSGGWKGNAGDNITFSGWTNCEKVEVYLNNALKKTITMRTHDGTNQWSSYKNLFSKDMAISDAEQFVAGSTIKFLGKNAGIAVDSQIFRPMLAASRIVVSPNPGQIGTSGDMSVVIVTIQDANGNIIPNADLSVTVNVSGAGTLIGLGSADADANLHGTEPEKYVNHRFTYQGMLKAFVQSTDASGPITVTASGAGLTSGSATVLATPDPGTSVTPQSRTSIEQRRGIAVRTFGAFLTIDNQNKAELTVTIYDCKGRRLLTVKRTSGSSVERVDLSRFGSGTFVYKAMSGGAVCSGKAIVSR
jgi:beta-galactosidase